MPTPRSDLTTLRSMTLRRIAVSAMDNNVYLLTHTGTGAQVLIDAADSPDEVITLIREGVGDVQAGVQAHLAMILTTHSHWDHVRALAQVKQITGARTACGSADASAIEVPMDLTLDHGDIGNFPGFELEAISLRGHTPGSTAFSWQPEDAPAQVFTGDSLFPGGVGKTTSPADFSSLIEDVSTRLFDRFGDDTVVHPGHGLPTTLGAERPHLDEWRSRGW